MGMLLYYLTEYFQKKKFNETLTMIFSILHILLAMFLIYTAYKGIIWSEDTHALFIFIFCFSVFYTLFLTYIYLFDNDIHL